MKNLIFMALIGFLLVVNFLQMDSYGKHKLDHQVLLEEKDSLILEYCTLFETSCNSVIRMELFAGVDTPDGMITLKEKLLISPVYIQNLNRHKFECEK